jgi:hypothetical protein
MNGENPTPRPLRVAAAGLVVCCILLAPAGARADTAPAITKPPVIAGIPRASEMLTASAEWRGDPAPKATRATRTGSAVTARQDHGGAASGGVPGVPFVLLTLLAAAAGVATGSSEVAPRLVRSAAAAARLAPRP